MEINKKYWTLNFFFQIGFVTSYWYVLPSFFSNEMMSSRFKWIVPMMTSYCVLYRCFENTVVVSLNRYGLHLCTWWIFIWKLCVQKVLSENFIDGNWKDFSGPLHSSHKQSQKMRHRSHKDVETWVKSNQKVT